jgi:hypothetical protein
MNDAAPADTENEISAGSQAALRGSEELRRFHVTAVENAAGATTGPRVPMGDAARIRDRLAAQNTALEAAIANAIAARDRLQREAADHRSRLDAIRAETGRTESILATTRVRRDALEREAIAQSAVVERSVPELQAAAAKCAIARELRGNVEDEANRVRERAGEEIAQIEATLRIAFDDRMRLDRASADARDRLVLGDRRLAALEAARETAAAELERLRQTREELGRLDTMQQPAPLTSGGDDADPTRAAAYAAAVARHSAQRDAAAIEASIDEEIHRLEGAAASATVQHGLVERRSAEDREQLAQATAQLVELNGRIATAIAQRADAEGRRVNEERRMDVELAMADAAFLSASAEVARSREAGARERERLEGIHMAIDRIDDAIQTAFHACERLTDEHAMWRGRIETVSGQITRVEAALREAVAEHERLDRFGREIEHIAGPKPELAIEVLEPPIALSAIRPSVGTAVPTAGDTDTGPADVAPRTVDPVLVNASTRMAPARDQEFDSYVGSFRERLHMEAPKPVEAQRAGATSWTLTGIGFVVVGAMLMVYAFGLIPLGPAAAVTVAALLFAFATYLRFR